MKRRVIDLGFAVAVLDLTPKGDDPQEPLLTILIPESDEDDAKCVYVIGSEGLHTLRTELADWLDAYDAEPPPSSSNGDDTESNGGNA